MQETPTPTPPENTEQDNGQSKRRLMLINLALILTGGLLVALYRYALGANETIIDFLVPVAVQVALYFFATWLILRARAARSTLIIVITFAALFRLSILFTAPYLSDDINRYIWDGRVQAAGINPYRYIPADKHLEFLRDAEIYPDINRKEYAHTIYPPLAQFLYLIVTRVSESITWMKTVLVGFEIITLCALAALLASFGMPRQRLLIYAWHPLIVWEIAGSGHVDAVSIAFIALALLARHRNKHAATGIALACATLIKIYPVALFPALFTYRDWRQRSWRMPLAFALILVAAYIPYLSVGIKGALGFLPDYTNEEGLQTGQRFFLLNLARHFFGAGRVPSAAYFGLVLVVLGVLAARAFFQRERRANSEIAHALAIAGAFSILLSPQYCWYFTWIVPLLCIATSVAWLPLLWLTATSFVLYWLWLDDQPDQALLINSLLYLPTALIAAFAWWRGAGFAWWRGRSNRAAVLLIDSKMKDQLAETHGQLSSPARVTVVIPALNEQEPIADVVRAIPREIASEVIVVDNGSDDLTAQCAEDAGARVVAEPHRGYGRACRAGVRALAPDCEIVVFLDGDGSDCPELMDRLVGPIIAGTHDFVIGSRTRGNREEGSMNFQQVFAGRVAGWLLHLLYGVSYSDMCPFRAIRRTALDDLGMREETYGWNLEMQMRAARAGLRILELPVDHRRRTGGESKVSGTLRGTLLAGTRIVLTLARVAAER